MDTGKVIINVTMRDVVISNAAAMWLSPQTRYGLLGIVVVFPAVMLNSLDNYFEVVLVCLLMGTLGTFLVLAIIAIFNPSLKRGILGRHEFEIGEKGFIERTDYNETTVAWASIDIVEEMFGLLMIRVSGASWYLLPTRDFIDSSHFGRFKHQLRANADVKGS